MLRYRVCKSFEVESGHMLSKHAGLCRFPHGHSRRIDVVLSAARLDSQDMVADFKALKLAMTPIVRAWDHAMAMNSADPMLGRMGADQRVVVFEGEDPTTEVMARAVYEHLSRELRSGKTYTDENGQTYRLPGPESDVRLERVRVTETSSSWAEYGE
ncbi:MAG: 6-pyruvoyl trahydropterin synthase family protein [Phycisphaerales bacterium]|mgnify:FL=1|jgi:6-pyruvoyltetrahydropterin/6-carboxytetrahydropterin synthase